MVRDWSVQAARAERIELLYQQSCRMSMVFTGLILEAPSRTVPQPSMGPPLSRPAG